MWRSITILAPPSPETITKDESPVDREREISNKNKHANDWVLRDPQDTQIKEPCVDARRATRARIGREGLLLSSRYSP
jgi:hypothetical protein